MKRLLPHVWHVYVNLISSFVSTWNINRTKYDHKKVREKWKINLLNISESIRWFRIADSFIHSFHHHFSLCLVVLFYLLFFLVQHGNHIKTHYIFSLSLDLSGTFQKISFLSKKRQSDHIQLNHLSFFCCCYNI